MPWTPQGYALDAMRVTHAKAYAPWTKADDLDLAPAQPGEPIDAIAAPSAASRRHPLPPQEARSDLSRSYPLSNGPLPLPPNPLGTKPLQGLLNGPQPDIAHRMTSKFISIRGAREHNLKNISLELPREKLVVITGLSGSGKSSLAFDTIYAEGQRRYVESLSAYARQFLDMMQKPDVDHIDGLSPAISIEQKTTSRNPRSTVGTVTEIYDYMRLLWARVGIPYSPATGLPIESQTVSQMVDRVLALPEGTRLYLLAPIARGRKGEYRKDFAELQKKGFQRVKVDGKFYEIAEAPPSTRSSSTTSTWWSTASWCARHRARGSPTASRRRSA